MINLMVKPTEVSTKARRRRFTTAEKIRILREADVAARETGGVAALLRREGLYSSHFGCLEDARAYCVDFFAWYNGEHHHSGIGLNTPNDVHYGRAQQRREDRARVLVAAHAAHPERFVHGVPEAPALPTAVWINKPIADQSDQIEINSLN